MKKWTADGGRHWADGERVQSEHGLAVVPDTDSAVPVGLRTLSISGWGINVTDDAKEGPRAVENSFRQALLARGLVMVMERELEWQQRVQGLR